MEAHFQIVGCLLSSKPGDALIDGFVAGVRRERAVVTARHAQGATFVRFNAAEAKLVAMACAAAAGPDGSRLRFGFASGTNDVARAGQDVFSISNRYIAQAHELAAAARGGEVLVTPRLALLCVEAGFTFDTREVKLTGGRKLMACVLDPTPVEAQGENAADPNKKVNALGGVFQMLLAQADEVARKQDDLEARHDAAPSAPARGNLGGTALHPAGLAADLDAQLTRLEARFAAIDRAEQRIDRLEQRLQSLAGQETLVQTRATGVVHTLHDIDVKLELLGEQRTMVDHVGEKVARLDFTMQEAHNMLRALQSEREVAERVEQGLKALRARSAAPKSKLHGELLTAPLEPKGH